MKVLDKIYLLDYQALGMSHSWYDKPQVVEGIIVKPENVEYVRKDFLLEWAKELEQKRLMGYIMFDELINKLEQL